MSYNVTLLAAQNATRVRVETFDSTQIIVEVGDLSQTWPEGCYIEVVNLSNSGAEMQFVAAAGATLNILSGDVLSNYGEYGRVSYLGSDVWELHLYRNVTAAPVEPNRQIVYGTDTAIDSAEHFLYDTTTGLFAVNATFGPSGVAPIDVSNPEPIFIYGADATGTGIQSASITLRSGRAAAGSSGRSGDISLEVPNSDDGPGNINLRASDVGGAQGGFWSGGAIDIRAGSNFSGEFSGGIVYIYAGDSGEAYGKYPHGGHILLQSGRQSTTALLDGKAGILLKGGGDGEDQGRAVIVNGNAAIGFSSSFGAFDESSIGSAVENADYGLDGQLLVSRTKGYQAAWVDPSFKPAPLSVVQISLTAFDLGAAGDHNTLYRVNATTDCTLTVRAESAYPNTSSPWWDPSTETDVATPIGGTILVGKSGVGNVIFVAAPGVTINTPDSLIIDKLHGKVTLTKVAPNVWDLEGNLAPL